MRIYSSSLSFIHGIIGKAVTPSPAFAIAKAASQPSASSTLLLFGRPSFIYPSIAASGHLCLLISITRLPFISFIFMLFLPLSSSSFRHISITGHSHSAVKHSAFAVSFSDLIANMICSLFSSSRLSSDLNGIIVISGSKFGYIFPIMFITGTAVSSSY